MSTAKGWHSRGYLPHFDSPETVQFVTFRLVDSLPQAVVAALRLKDRADRRWDEELDVGIGACWLRRSEIASVVQDTLLHFDGSRYRLLAWCIMPNHVHVVVEMFAGYPLSQTLKSWKSFSARAANMKLGRSGSFWDPDYFDRYMRDEEHLAHTIQYVEQNPVKAGLVSSKEAWPWGSACLRTDT